MLSGGGWKLIEYVKLFISLTSKVIMGITLFCVVAIIIPVVFLDKINLLEIRNDNLHWIWVALIASFLLINF